MIKFREAHTLTNDMQVHLKKPNIKLCFMFGFDKKVV